MRSRLKAQEPEPTGKLRIDMRLLDLYSACLKNADELLKEAGLLFEAHHHARAYFLAFTAMEELGKSQAVADYFYELISKSEFEAAFRDHRFKAAYVERYVQIPTDLKSTWFIEYDTKSVTEHTKARNRSLYVGHSTDHSPQYPSEMISAEAASELITNARSYLSRIVRMEHITERIGTKAFTK